MRVLTLLAAAAVGLSFSLLVSPGTAQEGTKARCPVSGQAVEVKDTTKWITVNGEKTYFCCENCPKAFAANPEKFVKKAGNCPVNTNGPAKVSPETRVVINNSLYYTCCPNCPAGLSSKTEKFVKELADPVTGKPFAVKADSPRAKVGNATYIFASAESKAAFEKEPAKYAWPYK